MPYSDRLDQLDRVLATAEFRAAIVEAVERRTSTGSTGTHRPASPERVVEVLRLLVLRTKADGTVSESLDQLAAANPFTSLDKVRRAVAVLREAGVVEVVEAPVSPGRHGGRGRPTVYRVTFLREFDANTVRLPDARRYDLADDLGPFGNTPPDPVDNVEWARTSCGSFAGMGAHETGMGAHDVHTPSVLQPRVCETSSGDTYIGSDSTSPESDEALRNRQRARAAVEVVKRRTALTNAQRAQLILAADAAAQRWPNADADRIAEWVVADYAQRVEVAKQLDDNQRVEVAS